MIQGLSLNLWTEVLSDIQQNPKTNITEIYKRVGCTYAHVLNIIKLLEEQKMVIVDNDGSSSIITTTPKGIIIANYIQYIKNNIGGNKNG